MRIPTDRYGLSAQSDIVNNPIFIFYHLSRHRAYLGQVVKRIYHFSTYCNDYIAPYVDIGQMGKSFYHLSKAWKLEFPTCRYPFPSLLSLDLLPFDRHPAGPQLQLPTVLAGWWNFSNRQQEVGYPAVKFRKVELIVDIHCHKLSVRSLVPFFPSSESSAVAVSFLEDDEVELPSPPSAFVSLVELAAESPGILVTGICHDILIINY